MQTLNLDPDYQIWGFFFVDALNLDPDRVYCGGDDQRSERLSS
jgi:hypothetical protein